MWLRAGRTELRTSQRRKRALLRILDYNGR
jgi:hypothetical protein